MKASESKETREGHEEWGREGKRKNSAGVYMRNVLHRLMCLDTLVSNLWY